ncbi:MAG: rhodanese-like domain-containing protein [Bacteroidetes bacterium]|jgi:rhodanese-related sulfurtransferase|nr:rhodanese-like domain-containing protein [Bacteroidota bacterium]
MSFFGLFNKSNNSNDIMGMLEEGAVILDVRSPGEYASGHIPGSRNIPLNQLPNRISEVKNWGKPVVTCCLSGSRSAAAVSMLASQGIQCVNGGSWYGIKPKGSPTK